MSHKSQQHEYNKDFYAWALHNAALIREGRLSEVDLENVAEEIESMGKSNRRELISRLSVLLVHLLKWKSQPGFRCNSLKYMIENQRFEARDLLDESPSLKRVLNDQLNYAYKKALILATAETGLNLDAFPKTSPFSLTEVLNENFLPE